MLVRHIQLVAFLLVLVGCRPIPPRTEPVLVQFRPRGHSMRSRIESGALCTVVPLAAADALAPGDVVLCRVRGVHYLHLVKAVDGNRCLIGNNRGGVNGWIGRTGVYGRLVAVAK